MNLKQVIAIALPLVGPQLFLLWLKFESRKRPIESPERTLTLTHGGPIWFLGAFLAFGLPGFLGFAWYQRAMHGPPDRSGPWPLVWLSMIFIAFGGWIMARAAINRIVVSNAGVAARPLRGNIKTARWEEIREIKFVAIASSLVLETNSGQRIWVDVFMIGFKAFEQAIKTNVPPIVYSSAIDALHKRYGA